jgi:hypothetical protein
LKFQADLGIEVILKLFSKEGLKVCLKLQKFQIPAVRFQTIETYLCFAGRIHQNNDPVIAFLQGKIQPWPYKFAKKIICLRLSICTIRRTRLGFWYHGNAEGKHLATLYLEDISDFIVECVDANFGFSRYAERLGRSANSLTSYTKLYNRNQPIDSVLLSTLKEKSKQFNLLVF